MLKLIKRVAADSDCVQVGSVSQTSKVKDDCLSFTRVYPRQVPVDVAVKWVHGVGLLEYEIVQIYWRHISCKHVDVFVYVPASKFVDLGHVNGVMTLFTGSAECTCNSRVTSSGIHWQQCKSDRKGIFRGRQLIRELQQMSEWVTWVCFFRCF